MLNGKHKHLAHFCAASSIQALGQLALKAWSATFNLQVTVASPVVYLYINSYLLHAIQELANSPKEKAICIMLGSGQGVILMC